MSTLDRFPPNAVQHNHVLPQDSSKRREPTDTVEKVEATNLKKFFQSPTVRRVRCFGFYPTKNNLRCRSALIFCDLEASAGSPGFFNARPKSALRAGSERGLHWRTYRTNENTHHSAVFNAAHRSYNDIRVRAASDDCDLH